MPSIQFYLGENIEENMYKKINGISSNLKKKPEDIISFIESFGFNFIEFVDEYKNTDSLVKYSCPVGHITERRVTLFYRHQTCRICSLKSTGKNGLSPYEKIERIVKEKGCTLISYISIPNRKNLASIIFQCGHEETLVFRNFQGRNGKYCSLCYEEMITGKNNKWWKDGLTPILIYLRQRISEWYRKSLELNDYKCVISGLPAQTIHHNYPFHSIVRESFLKTGFEIKEKVSDYKEEELKIIEKYFLELHNSYGYGSPLTNEIHNKFHSIFGHKNFTPENFYEFQYLISTGEIQI